MSNLSERLERMRNGSKLKPEIAATVARYFSEAQADPLPTGSRIPQFALPDHDGRVVSSASLLEQGPLVITFFRGTWCPFCNAEISALNDAYESIRNAGAELIAISPQSAKSAQDYRRQNPLNFRMLVDRDAKVAEAFGLAYTMPEYLQDLYRDVFGNDLTLINEAENWRLPVPGRFVVDRDAIIVDAQANPDYRFRPEPDTIIPILNRLVPSGA